MKEIAIKSKVLDEINEVLEQIHREGRITYAEYQKILRTTARGLKEVSQCKQQ